MTLGEFKKKTEYVSDDTPLELFVEFNDCDNKITVGGECNSVFSSKNKVVLFREVN